MTHETVTLQGFRRLAVMLGLLLLVGPAVTFARRSEVAWVAVDPL